MNIHRTFQIGRDLERSSDLTFHGIKELVRLLGTVSNCILKTFSDSGDSEAYI